MLAALLCNRIGNAAGKIKEQRLIEGLRKDYFERQKAQDKQQTVSQAKAVPALKKVFQVPSLPEITAQSGDSVDADELALLLIIAEL